jgi:hypothetical protein
MAKLNKDNTHYTIQTGPQDSPVTATASSKTAAVVVLQKRGLTRAKARDILGSLTFGEEVNVVGNYGNVVVKFTETAAVVH